ncbi:MAG: hypothetical protein OEZ16_06980 [Chromatiales bacterium]|nr:hypothetical protein [Chromatiales bacterium]
MALLFDTPAPVTTGKYRFHVCRLVSDQPGAAGEKELREICRRLGIPARAIEGRVAHIAGGQISIARMTGAREITPRQMDKLLRTN